MAVTFAAIGLMKRAYADENALRSGDTTSWKREHHPVYRVFARFSYQGRLPTLHTALRLQSPNYFSAQKHLKRLFDLQLEHGFRGNVADRSRAWYERHQSISLSLAWWACFISCSSGAFQDLRIKSRTRLASSVSWK